MVRAFTSASLILLGAVAAASAQDRPQFHIDRAAQPPKIDGWGTFLRYGSDGPGNNYAIQSYGRDKASSTINCGTTTNFNEDIVYSNGTFVQWPEGTQF